jgi:FkbM family methyltransferase
MLRNCNIQPRIVIHAGAHDLIESDIYDIYKAKVYAIECNPFVYQNLITRVNNNYLQIPIYACLWSINNQKKKFRFYRNNQDGAGGLFEPEKMGEYIKDCPMLEETFELTTTTMDTLCIKEIKDYLDVDFLNVDLQGSELEFFKGANLILESKNLKYIWCEVSWDKVYKDAPLLQDIDYYLARYGFNRVGIRRDWEIHGDALYCR